MQFDRILETCWRQAATDVVLAPGNPPLIRTLAGWRVLASPPLAAEEIKAAADERLSPKPDGDAGSYAYSDFRYGDVATFRAVAFGYPHATTLVLTLLRADLIHYRPPEER